MTGISRSRFEVLVDDALDTIPQSLLELLDNVVVQVEDRDESEPELLGVYRGTALTDRGRDYTFELPDTITIFRLALVDFCTDEGGVLDEDAVRDEVAVTVVHEIGHHFGIDDERLHELGWG